jgi:hypothetical protein
VRSLIFVIGAATTHAILFAEAHGGRDSVAPTRATKSIDRRLILKGLAVGAAAAVLPGIARTSALDLSFASLQSDRHLEPLPALWEQISSLARWAPTPHNTQPFRLAPRDDRTADIIILTDRMLPREDHGNRYVTSAFGIFASALRRAGQHFGHTVDIIPVSELDVASLHLAGPRATLGRATITGPCERRSWDLLAARRTSRLPYHDRLVSDASIDSLGEIARRYGHRLITTADRATVEATLHLNANAVVDYIQIDDEREETGRWTRFGPTPQYGDGLWQRPMNQPAWELRAAFHNPRAFRLPGVHHLAVMQYLRTQRGTRHVGLLCGKFEAWPELIRGGECLLDFWLEMARLDIYMHPMGSMLTSPRYAAEIARRFNVPDCWLIFRFGYSDLPPRAPRLQTVVIDE